MLHLDLRVVRLSSINIPARSEREIVMRWHPGQVWIESIYQGLIFWINTKINLGVRSQELSDCQCWTIWRRLGKGQTTTGWLTGWIWKLADDHGLLIWIGPKNGQIVMCWSRQIAYQCSVWNGQCSNWYANWIWVRSDCEELTCWLTLDCHVWTVILVRSAQVLEVTRMS